MPEMETAEKFGGTTAGKRGEGTRGEGFQGACGYGRYIGRRNGTGHAGVCLARACGRRVHLARREKGGGGVRGLCLVVNILPGAPLRLGRQGRAPLPTFSERSVRKGSGREKQKRESEEERE